MENNTKNPENRFGFYPGFGDNRNIFAYPIPTHDYVIYIDDLSWLEDHQERLQLIRMASPDDSIRIVINTPGGVVSIAMAYVNAMAESAANIVTHAEGHVCSAGTVLWLAGVERTVSPLTVFMFHNYQGGTWGDGANMHSQIVFEREYFNRLIDRFYNGVLTNEEIASIKGGGQVWMDEVQVLERTDAVLLDSKNIKRMQKGQPPIVKGKPQGEPSASEDEQEKGPEIKKVKVTVTVNGEDFTLEAANIQEKDLAQFSTKELYAILTQFAGLVGSDLSEDTAITGDTPRGGLIAELVVYGNAISEMLLASQEE